MSNVARPVGEAGGGLRRTTLAIGDNAVGGHEGKRWYSRCGETAHPVQQQNNPQSCPYAEKRKQCENNRATNIIIPPPRTARTWYCEETVLSVLRNIV